MRVNDIIGGLSAIQNDWPQILANPRFIRRNNIISWDKYEKMWLGEFVTAEDFRRLVDKGQFSFQILEDGSVVQLFYEFDNTGNKLLRACLAYYGTPEEFGEKNPEPQAIGETSLEEDTNENEERDSDFNNIAVVSKWIRLDYDSDSKDSVVHGRCHLHIGGMPNSRLLVKGVPGPAQFIEWSMAIFYPELYNGHRLADGHGFLDISHMQEINTLTVEFSDHDIYTHMTHIQIP